MYAHRLTGSCRSSRARVQFVSTERDGSTRNSLNVQAAQNEIRANAGENIFFCIHRIVPGCNLTGSGNDCGVPHSMLSRSEQELASPFELYWEDDIQGNSTRYFQKGRRMGTQEDIRSSFTVRDDCVQLYPTFPLPPSLILPTFRGVWIRTEFDSNVGPLSSEQQAEVAQLLYDALNVSSGAVIPTNLDVSSGEAFCLDAFLLLEEFYLEFPSDQVSEDKLGDLEVMVMRGGYLDEALGTEVLELEVAGRRPRNKNDDNDGPPKPKKKKSNRQSKSSKSSKSRKRKTGSGCHY
jgi:hypothetical protein